MPHASLGFTWGERLILCSKKGNFNGINRDPGVSVGGKSGLRVAGSVGSETTSLNGILNELYELNWLISII